MKYGFQHTLGDFFTSQEQQLWTVVQAANMPTDEEMQNMDNEVMNRCLHELGANQWAALTHIMACIKIAASIKGLPAHGEMAKEKEKMLDFQASFPINEESVKAFFDKQLGEGVFEKFLNEGK